MDGQWEENFDDTLDFVLNSLQVLELLHCHDGTYHDASDLQELEDEELQRQVGCTIELAS